MPNSSSLLCENESPDFLAKLGTYPFANLFTAIYLPSVSDLCPGVSVILASYGTGALLKNA